MQSIALPLDTKEKKEASKTTDIYGLHPLSIWTRVPSLSFDGYGAATVMSQPGG
jgi:hypothetical protein